MVRLYTKQPLTINTEMYLDIDLTKHIQALRLKPQQQLVLFNGNNKNYLATIINITKNNVQVTINSESTSTIINELELHLAIALVSSDKLDLIIRSATELGITKITPLITKYSQRISKDRLENRLTHWQKIIISACEQSNQNLLPSINKPISLNEFNQQIEASRLLKIALSPHHKTQKDKLPKQIDGAIIAIGPEGGWHEHEIMQLQLADYTLLQLGSQILRSETACSAALVTIKTLYANWLT